MNHLRFAPAAALAAAAILVSATAAPAVADPARLHGPVQARRNDDGSLKHGPNFTVLTANWAGYAVANFATGQRYTAAAASWIVAPVTFGQTTSGTSDEFAASWVGVGGYCTNAACTSADNSLIQLGTDSDVSDSGDATYFAWYEMLPEPAVTIPLAIHAGDEVTASLECKGPCIGAKQPWTLEMTDLTTNEHWSHTFAYSSSLLSVEWIEEAPVSGGVLPLADFNVVPFAASADGIRPVITFANNGIAMEDPWGQIAVPTAPDAYDDFDVCWAFEALPTCGP